MATTSQRYLDEFKKTWLTEQAKLKSVYDQWVEKLKNSSQLVAFKNAYQTYTSGLNAPAPVATPSPVTTTWAKPTPVTTTPVSVTPKQWSTDPVVPAPAKPVWVKVETTTPTLPEPTPTPTTPQTTGELKSFETKTPEYKDVVSLQDWVNRGKKPTELVDYVGKKYGITTEYDSATNTILGYDANGRKTAQCYL